MYKVKLQHLPMKNSLIFFMMAYFTGQPMKQDLQLGLLA
jgi:hypothetical protein